LPLLGRELSRARLSSLLIGGLFIGALMTGVGLNALYATQNNLLDYYGASPPAAARAVTAVPGNAQATVHWTVPLTNGGAPITGYVVTPYIGFFAFPSHTFASPATSEVITGLTNGRTYVFKVAATNPIGVGTASVFSTGVTVGAPSAPLSPAATPGKNQVTLRWSAPATTNGSPITAYVVTPYITGKAQPLKVYKAAARTQVLLGLLNGRSYTFKVAARNANGTGPQSAGSPAVIVAGAPGPPTAVKGVRVRAAQVRLTFVKGLTNGLPITSFSATCTSSDGGIARTKTGPASPILVTGLTLQKTYTCRVKESNARGTSVASGATKRITA
jgi:hypothetical protein